MPAEPPWLLVSKPLRPPFRDGSTVLVRNLVDALPVARRVAYFGDPGAPIRDGSDRVLAGAATGYAPGLRHKAAILRRLMDREHRTLPVCFFFTPNRTTSSVLAGLRRLQPRRLILQSVTSSHEVERFADSLRDLDAVAVASETTRQRLCDAGLDAEQVVCIRPGIEIGEPRRAAPPEPILIYAGDLDGGVVPYLVALARMLDRPELRRFTLVVATRPKGEQYAAAHSELRRGLAEAVARGRVRILGEVDDMPALLRRAALQLFVADHVRNKVDLPLTLLEGMAIGVPVFMRRFSPVDEIFALAERHRLNPGLCLDGDSPQRFAAALAETLADDAALLRFGRDARALAEREFTATKMATAYDELFASLETRLGQHRQP